MSKKGINYLVAEAHMSIDYCRQEFDMSYAELVGAYTCIIHDLMCESVEDDGEENYDREPAKEDA